MPDPVTPNLGLTLPVLHEQAWGVGPTNANWGIIDTWAAGVMLLNPAASQIIGQPDGTYLNIRYLQSYGATPAVRFGVAPNVWDSAITRTVAGHFTFDTNAAGNGLGTVSAAGFQYLGAAPAGHFLVGNGTYYVDSSTLPAGVVKYQTIQSAGVPEPQEGIINFLADFVLTDNPGNTSTDVKLANTAVAPGSYTAANITVNAQGRITAASNGTAAVAATINDVTGARTLGTTYQNTSAFPIAVSGYGTSVTGSATCNINVSVGPVTPSIVVFSQTNGATVAGGAVGFYGLVPAGYFYSVNKANDLSATPGKWIETVIS